LDYALIIALLLTIKTNDIMVDLQLLVKITFMLSDQRFTPFFICLIEKPSGHINSACVLN
jgi:hypothetical protein